MSSKPIGPGRPAESVATAAGAVAALLGYAFHLDRLVVAELTVIVGAIPAAVTWFVELRRRPPAD